MSCDIPIAVKNIVDQLYSVPQLKYGLCHMPVTCSLSTEFLLKKTAKPQNKKAKGTIKRRCSGISLLKSFSRIRLKTWWLKWSNKSHLYHLSSRILIQLYKRRCLSVLYRGAKPKSPGFRMSMSVYAMKYSLSVGLFFFHLFIAYPK